MNIIVENTQKDLLFAKNTKEAIKRIVLDILEAEKQSCHELFVYLVPEKKIIEVHEEFFDDPTPTDCISLPLDTEPDTPLRVLGEIFVCPKVAIAYTIKKGGSPYKEATLYLVHALLHLLGYDDIDPVKRAIMRRKEQKYMRRLEEKNLLLQPK